MHAPNNACQTCELIYVIRNANTCLQLWEFATWRFIWKGLTVFLFQLNIKVASILLSSALAHFDFSSCLAISWHLVFVLLQTFLTTPLFLVAFFIPERGSQSDHLKNERKHHKTAWCQPWASWGDPWMGRTQPCTYSDPYQQPCFLNHYWKTHYIPSKMRHSFEGIDHWGSFCLANQ